MVTTKASPDRARIIRIESISSGPRFMMPGWEWVPDCLSTLEEKYKNETIDVRGDFVFGFERRM